MLKTRMESIGWKEATTHRDGIMLRAKKKCMLSNSTGSE